MRCTRRLLVLLGLAAALTSGQAQETQEHALARVHTVRVRIEPRADAPAGACDNFGPQDLTVELRGQVVSGPDAVEIDRVRRPTVHALIVDASWALRDRRDVVRAAATEYLEALELERDRALILGSDDDVRLLAAPTRDRARLVAALADVKPGAAAALHDALLAAADELALLHERGAIVVVTNGVDTTSFAERDDVLEHLRRVPSLAVFVVGLDVPTSMVGRSSYQRTTRKFLQRMADATGGAYVDVPTGGRVLAAYRRVRRMLEAEAVVSVVDPDPTAPPGRLRVESARAGCSVKVLPGVPDAVAPEVAGADAPGVVADPFVVEQQSLEAKLVVDPACGDGRTGGDLVDDGARLRGCVLGLTVDRGVLYAPRVTQICGSVAGTKVRPLEVYVPPLDALATDPADALDVIAAHARATRADPIERHWAMSPAHDHARPFHDQPSLVDARSLLVMRAPIASALARRADYGAWLDAAVQRETARELARYEERLQRSAPGLPAAMVHRTALESEAGKRILARADRPSGNDRVAHLAAWLGDVPAHELLARWERRWADRLVRGEVDDDARGAFEEGYRALRDLWFVPSYARTLGLLVAVREPDTERIGFWRVVLPRPTWLTMRPKGLKSHPEWGHLPFDLVPDLPLGWIVLRDAMANDPDLATWLRAGGWGVRAVRYAVHGKPWRQQPLTAFLDSRVTIELARGDETIRLDADLDLDRGKREAPPTVSAVALASTATGGAEAQEIAWALADPGRGTSSAAWRRTPSGPALTCFRSAYAIDEIP